MKKTIILTVVLFILLVSSAYSQSILTEKQQKEYEKQKVTIYIRDIAHYTDYGSYNQLSYIEQKWDPYINYKKISEEKFLKLAGYDLEARNAASFKRKGRILFWGGIVMFLAGATWGTSETEIDSDYTTPMVLMIGGLGVWMWGVLGYYGKKSAPSDIAVEAAEKYNAKLYLGITRKF